MTNLKGNIITYLGGGGGIARITGCMVWWLYIATVEQL